VSKSKKIAIIVAVAVAVIGIGGGAAFWAMSRQTSEDRLYKAISQEAPYEFVSIEQMDNGDSQAKVKGIVTRDGNFKSDGEITCKSSITDLGDLQAKMRVRQVGSKVYLQYKHIGLSNGIDAETEQGYNEYFDKYFNGKWALVNDKEPMAEGYKKYGLAFSVIGAYSKSHETSEVLSIMREEKVLTLLNNRDSTFRGKDVTEYSVLVRRSAYESMIDRLRTNYMYKDDVLSYIFDDNDTIEASVMVDRETGKPLGATQSIANPCLDFLVALEESAGEDLTGRVEVTNYFVAGNDIPEATTPANAVKIEEIYDAIMADYEAVEE
jgi:hypothetical protein